MTRSIILAAVALIASGCGTPMNLAYDFGRSYSAAFQTQADLTRASVAAAQYRLSGIEGTFVTVSGRSVRLAVWSEPENVDQLEWSMEAEFGSILAISLVMMVD